MVSQFQIKTNFPFPPLSENISSIISTSRAGSILFSVRESRRRTHTERERERCWQGNKRKLEKIIIPQKRVIIFLSVSLSLSLSSLVNDWSEWSPHNKALLFHRYTLRSWLPSLLLDWTDEESSHSAALSLFSLGNQNEKGYQLRNEIWNVATPKRKEQKTRVYERLQ